MQNCIRTYSHITPPSASTMSRVEEAFVKTASDGINEELERIEAAKQEGKREVLTNVIQAYIQLFKRGDEKIKVEGLRQVLLFLQEEELAIYLDEWLEGREVNIDNLFKKKDDVCFDALPDKLCTPRAKELWRELCKAGYVDRNCRTLRSRAESAYIARRMACLLGLKRYWEDFSKLWSMSNLRSAIDKTSYMKNCDNFIKDIDCILS